MDSLPSYVYVFIKCEPGESVESFVLPAIHNGLVPERGDTLWLARKSNPVVKSGFRVDEVQWIYGSHSVEVDIYVVPIEDERRLEVGIESGTRFTNDESTPVRTIPVHVEHWGEDQTGTLGRARDS